MGEFPKNYDFKTSELTWQKFWEEADTLELDDVYGTDGRLVREIANLRHDPRAPWVGRSADAAGNWSTAVAEPA